MTTKQPDFSDLNALAIEACDMWQEHLSNLANNPDARAELTRFLEPQRRLFADWATMMQKANKTGGDHEDPVRTQTSSKPDAPAATPSPTPTPPGGASHGDDPLRVAQLALRLAELEKRIARLESSGSAAKPGAARRAQRASS